MSAPGFSFCLRALYSDPTFPAFFTGKLPLPDELRQRRRQGVQGRVRILPLRQGRQALRGVCGQVPRSQEG